MLKRTPLLGEVSALRAVCWLRDRRYELAHLFETLVPMIAARRGQWVTGCSEAGTTTKEGLGGLTPSAYDKQLQTKKVHYPTYSEPRCYRPGDVNRAEGPITGELARKS